MKHNYKISGMTCNGCKAGVEKYLKEINGVTNSLADVEKGEVEIEMDNHISITELQKALPEKYKITEQHSAKDVTIELADEESEFKQLFPLFLIFGYITVAAILINRTNWDIGNFMLDFMGLFYVVFSFFKLLDLKGFPESFKMYDPIAKIVPAYGWVYPFIEIALGLMFLCRFEINIALYVTIIVLGATTIGVSKVLLDKKAIKCACLGTALKLPMTKATFIENAIMIVMAVFMLLK